MKKIKNKATKKKYYFLAMDEQKTAATKTLPLIAGINLAQK